jgi:His/Glu/Gln/Arg/opine family amino acid ABC transporter permease subunit
MGFWHTMIEVFPRFMPVLLGGAVTAVEVAAGALAVALAGGLVLALATLAPFPVMRVIARAYIEVVRGAPALTQLFIIYFGLSDIGLELSPMAAAIIGLGGNGAAYLAEVYRAGISAIHKGQREAALSLGLPPADVMRFVVLPQATRIMVPPFCNFAIQVLLATSLVSTVAAPEIMFRARNLVMETYLSTHVYILAAMLYLVVSIPLSHFTTRLERRLKGAR